MSKIKTLKEIEGEIIDAPSDNFMPCLVLDTGGLIDIIASARIANLGRNNLDDLYKNSQSFLNCLSGRQSILIIDAVMQEIEKHKLVRLNKNNYEIPDRCWSFVEDAFSAKCGVHDRLDSFVDPEKVRYDVYWATKLAFEDVHKKIEEGFSDVDKKLLSFCAYLSSSDIGGKRVQPVGIITSDSHIVRGVDFLRDHAGYMGIYSINTRKRKRKC